VSVTRKTHKIVKAEIVPWDSSTLSVATANQRD
jgi:hypothetical protein